jgi:hypothetical protein
MKATKAQIQTRVEEVLRIRLDGAEFWDVREYAREKEREAGSSWELPPGGKPLSDGQLWRYITRADQLIAESCRASRKKLLRRHLAQRRNLFAKAVSSGDIRTALAVLRDEAELQGIYPPKKIAPTTPDGGKQYGPLDDATRVAAITALLACYGAGNPGSALDGEGDAGRPPVGGPEPDPDAGGDASRPVAAPGTAEPGAADPAPLFPAGG